MVDNFFRLWYSGNRQFPKHSEKEKPAMEATVSKVRPLDMAYIAVFAALMAICSWISIPTAIPFTLQTMGVFLTVGLLGGRRGTLAVLVYILLGAVGAPVFAGFSGGVSALFSQSGGYILGFLFSALLMWGLERFVGQSLPLLAVSMVLGLLVCYAFGTAWFMILYSRSTGPVTLAAALGWCVIPYILPDLVKIAVALTLTARLRRHVR